LLLINPLITSNLNLRYVVIIPDGITKSASERFE